MVAAHLMNTSVSPLAVALGLALVSGVYVFTLIPTHGQRIAALVLLALVLGGGYAYAQISCPCVPGSCDPLWFFLGICVPPGYAPVGLR
jgi:hypothetical protein